MNAQEKQEVNRNKAQAAKILITDDDTDFRWMLSILLREEGLEPLEAADGAAALRLVRSGSADLILLDLMLPGMSGLEVVREVRKINAALPVIMVTGHATTGMAVQAGKAGVQGILTKPCKNDEIALMVWTALEGSSRAGRRRAVYRHGTSGAALTELMGPSAAVQGLAEKVKRVAATDFTVIVSGETGAGKEVVAKSIHSLSRRAEGPFVPIDCGAIPPNLIESELFGHEKGAFTGADALRKGCFEAASGGTLFLDEIGNLPPAMQAKLLRALQERRISRVGSPLAVEFDARVVCATNEDLPALVENGKFRRDLYYRLNEFDISVPPLRERRDDVVYLARRFLSRSLEELQKEACEITAGAIETLRAHSWPGNVRELQNVIRRAVLIAENHVSPEELTAAGLRVSAAWSGDGSTGSGARTFKELVRNCTLNAEREVLSQALKETRGNMKQAARALRMDYKTIRSKIKFHKLNPFE